MSFVEYLFYFSVRFLKVYVSTSSFIIQGQESVKKRSLDLIAKTQSKFFIMSKIDDVSVSLISLKMRRSRTGILW